VINGECDVLRDEGEAYARKLIQAGVQVTALRYMAPCQNNLPKCPYFAMISRTSEWSNLLRARRHVGGRGCFGEIR
jgi:acetyl esterase/lipase